MAGMNPILAKQQLTDINRAIAAINKAMQECDIAESCGVDCADRRAALQQMRSEADMFKSTYFPNAHTGQ